MLERHFTLEKFDPETSTWIDLDLDLKLEDAVEYLRTHNDRCNYKMISIYTKII